MFAGVEIGVDWPEGAEGVAPQVSRLCCALVEPVFDPVLVLLDPVDPVVEPVDPVVVPDDDELVAAPVGLAAVGTTAGTEVQALS